MQGGFNVVKEARRGINDIVSFVTVSSPVGADVVSANLNNFPFSGNVELMEDCKICSVDLIEFYMALSCAGVAIIYNKDDFSVSRLNFECKDNKCSWNINGDWKVDISVIENTAAEFVAKIPLIIKMEHFSEEYLLNLIFSSRAERGKYKSVIRMPMIDLSVKK